MLKELVKVARKLDSLGLTKDANDLNTIIHKISIDQSERDEFAAMQREMRQRSHEARGIKPPESTLTEAEQVARDAKRWKEQQAMEAEEPEAKIMELAATEAKRFARMKHQLFQTKRRLGPDDEDTKRLQLKLADQKIILDEILNDASQISKMCRYDAFKIIQEILAAPMTHGRS